MTKRYALPLFLFFLVASTRLFAYAGGAIGFTWEQRGGPAALRVVLPRPEASPGYGAPEWAWAAFQVSEQGAQAAYTVLDVEQNVWLQFPESVATLSYGTEAVGLMPEPRTIPDPAPVCPFPEEFPAELQPYRQPSALIESDHPEIIGKAQELVDLAGVDPNDMLAVAHAILESDYMASRPYDYPNLHGVQNGTVTESFNDVYVDSALVALRRGVGVCASNSRLGVALLRARGIPAHTVSKIGLHVWMEFWVNGLGWFPAEVTGSDHDWPKQLSPGEGLLNIASGQHDTCVWILWEPHEPCYFRLLNYSEYHNPAFLDGAKLFVALPGERLTPGPMLAGKVPPLLGGNYGYFFREGDDYYFRLYNPAGQMLGETWLELGEFQSCWIAPETYWRMRPHKDQEWLLLESHMFTLVPGDLNYDAVIDLTDLAILLSNYPTESGAVYEDGDIDGDGDVDLADLSALLAVYGTTCE